MQLIDIFFILTGHFIFDFICQTHEEATNKSTSWEWLLSHTGKYSILWTVSTLIYFIIYFNFEEGYNYQFVIVFGLITFAAHTITDYITSREVKKFFDKKDYHNGFVVIGLDQLLHYVQLIFTFIWLKNIIT